jgi:hypothetical protein
MRKIALATVATAVLVGAAPAYAIHDPNVPAGDCAADNSQAVGHPAADIVGPLGVLVHSNMVIAEHNNADAQCPPNRPI